jgi:hypothetical protein
MKQAASKQAYYSTLKMEAIYSTETSVDFHRTARCYISEDRIIQKQNNKILFCVTDRNIG